MLAERGSESRASPRRGIVTLASPFVSGRPTTERSARSRVIPFGLPRQQQIQHPDLTVEARPGLPVRLDQHHVDLPERTQLGSKRRLVLLAPRLVELRRSALVSGVDATTA